MYSALLNSENIISARAQIINIVVFIVSDQSNIYNIITTILGTIINVFIGTKYPYELCGHKVLTI